MSNRVAIRADRLKRARPQLPALLLALTGTSTFAVPVVPPAAIDQFQHVIGNRVEAVTILGGDYGAAGGIYTFRGGAVADLSVARMGGGGVVAEPKAIGVGEIQWALVMQGNLGDISAQNTIDTGYLQGNQSRTLIASPSSTCP